ACRAVGRLDDEPRRARRADRHQRVLLGNEARELPRLLLRDGVGAGRLALAVTSLTFVQQQSGQFPSFVAKENALVAIGAARAARLIIEATDGPACVPADFNCDGAVNGDDLGRLLAAWGICGTCAEDLTGDGAVDGDDLGRLLSEWS
ncbi:MAG: hypothetical protein ACKOEP_00610, partial [Phycisphaerales bacterium]